jgi:hypothetical protein
MVTELTSQRINIFADAHHGCAVLSGGEPDLVGKQLFSHSEFICHMLKWRAIQMRSYTIHSSPIKISKGVAPYTVHSLVG